MIVAFKLNTFLSFQVIKLILVQLIKILRCFSLFYRYNYVDLLTSLTT